MSISVNEIRKLTYLLPRCGEDSSSCQFLVFPCAECSPKNRRYVLVREWIRMKIKVSQLVFFFFFKESPISPQECHQSHNLPLGIYCLEILPQDLWAFSAIVYFYPGRVMLTRSLPVDGVSWEVIAREAPKRMSYRILLGPWTGSA